ncbi:SH3 domain-binding glutamic acid-rich-like protein 3 [Osmerus eperlanus]|uniref:SH3 domain-binding glutamic acid-rich-like protein 3 n=1 Tax=Osmerus eperlanus TaxID=29151 RepID=UPI002E138AE3
MSILVYYTSVSSSREVKKQQSKIFSYLDSKKIAYKTLDISQSSEIKDEMRKKTGDPTSLPPQIFHGDTYCGDYSMFDTALEDETVEAFLKL